MIILSVQMSYADTFTATTANFFRIVPSEGSFNPGNITTNLTFIFQCNNQLSLLARVKLLKQFNWTKVGTIYQNTPRYALVSLDQMKLSSDKSLCIALIVREVILILKVTKRHVKDVFIFVSSVLLICELRNSIDTRLL